MPVHRGSDGIGPYYQWGQHGAKYYYQTGNTMSRILARQHAAKQGRAVQAQRHA